MSHHRRSHYDSHYPSGRLSYDDRDDSYDRDGGHDHETDKWRGGRDGSYSPRSRSHYDDTRHESWDRRTGDRLSLPHRRLERSRSPYYASNGSRPRRSNSRSASPD